MARAFLIPELRMKARSETSESSGNAEALALFRLWGWFQ